MPKKKKPNQLASKEKNFNAASEAFNKTIQSLQSTSLLPYVAAHYVAAHSPENYFRNAGFQVYNSRAHPEFQAALLPWKPAPVQDVTNLPQPYSLLYQGCAASYAPVAATKAIMAPTMPAAPITHAVNQSIIKLLTSLPEEAAIPCEMSWELEPNNAFQTMILKVPFRPRLPFVEKQSFPYFSGENRKFLSDPISTADSYVVQYYKCAMEWFHLLRSCTFPHELSNDDITNLVAYQITYDSLLQMINVLHLYLSANQNYGEQKVFVQIKDNSDQFSTLDKPRDLFQKNPAEIKKQLEILEEINRTFTLILMVQGVMQTEIRGIDSFHRVSPDLILYIQNGPFSDLETCNFTGLLNWLHSLTFLSKIPVLTQYTIETTDQAGRFLKKNYTAKILKFTPNEKIALPDNRGISASVIRAKLDRFVKSKNGLCKLPALQKEVLLTINEQAVDPLVLHTNADLAKQLYEYLINHSPPFGSSFAFYSLSTPVGADSLGLIFMRLTAVANYCAKELVMPLIRIEIAGSAEKKLSILEIIIAGYTFLIYPNYLSADNCYLIQEALCTQLNILILDHLTKDAQEHNVHSTISQSFYPLLKNHFQNYLTLVTTVDTYTREARQNFIERHNTDVTDLENKAAREADKLIAQEEQNKFQASKKNRSQIKILPRKELKETCTIAASSVSESLKVAVLNLPTENLLQKQLTQLQSEINRITGTRKLDARQSIQEKIDYLNSCINSFYELLAEKEQKSKIKTKNIDMLRAVLRVEIFYHLGLLLFCQATKFFNEQNINNFNLVLTTLKTLKKELEDISSLYASILAEQDSIPEDDSRTETLDMLIDSIDVIILNIDNNTEKVKNSLQLACNARQQEACIPRSRPVFQEPLYVAVKNYQTLACYFDLDHAMRDFNEVHGELSASSTSARSVLKKKNSMESKNPSPRPQVCLFSPQPARYKADNTLQDSSLDDTRSTLAASRSMST
jgi:hypothetical protein